MHDVNIGIELASEHAGRATRNITARNNLVYDATAIGVAIGGYDRHRGSTEDCVIVNNTIVNTDGVELLVQFDTRDNLIANNVIVAGARHDFVENPYVENVDNVLDHNLYSSRRRELGRHLAVEGHRLSGLRRVERRFGERPDARCSPILGSPMRPAATTRSASDSPAVDAGAFLAAAGTTDLAGQPRAQAGGIDLGAFEVAAPPPSPTPSIAAPVTYAGDLTWLQSDNGWGPPEVDRSNGERAPDDGGPIRIGAEVVRARDRRARAVADRRAAGRALLALPRGRRAG